MAGQRDSSGSERGQDPRVGRLRPSPQDPAPRVRTLVGFWAESDREGTNRLYLTTALDRFAEFSEGDVVGTEEVPPDQSPFVGEQATRVELRADAEVTFSQALRLDEVDEFDLDVRFGPEVMRISFNAYASSIGNACLKKGQPATDPCNHTCDAWLCKTFKGPGDADCCVGGSGGGHRTAATCETCYTCGTCPTDVAQTMCGTCYTDVGQTACGTCYTDYGRTQCGGCDIRARA